jgi:hypothetical protein
MSSFKIGQVCHSPILSHGLSLNTITNALTWALQRVNKRKTIQYYQLKFFQCSQHKQILFLNFLVLPLFCPPTCTCQIHSYKRETSTEVDQRTEKTSTLDDLRSHLQECRKPRNGDFLAESHRLCSTSICERLTEEIPFWGYNIPHPCAPTWEKPARVSNHLSYKLHILSSQCIYS